MDNRTMSRSELTIAIKPLGGIAGDMFAGACAALWPDLVDACLADLRAAGLPDGVETGFDDVRVNGFAARQLRVGQEGGLIVPTGDYGQIVARLEESPLDRDVLAVALGILRVLGEAEAAVHDRPLDHVHFHELADWDSVADVVAAASFVARARPARWVAGRLPLGGGTVKTQHGIVTVPAPATLKLLGGYEWVDDGLGGERVTPTGAAILRYLTEPGDAPATGRLAGSGFGAGTRRYETMANVVQLVAFQGAGAADEAVAELSFDIDDMTGEEMATAADRLRAEDGVLDVTQTAQIGKKGRAMMLFRVLCRPDRADDIARTCFAQTTTLGVRRAMLTRSVLSRDHVATSPRAKRASRPGGATAKAEADDLSGETLARRREMAREAERAALEAEHG